MNLTDLIKLGERATPGPWRVLPCDNGFAIAGGIVKYDRDDAGDINGPIGNESNAALIVALVNAWSRLRAVVEAAKEVDNRPYGEWADQPSEDSLDALRDAIKALEEA